MQRRICRSEHCRAIYIVPQDGHLYSSYDEPQSVQSPSSGLALEQYAIVQLALVGTNRRVWMNTGYAIQYVIWQRTASPATIALLQCNDEIKSKIPASEPLQVFHIEISSATWCFMYSSPG